MDKLINTDDISETFIFEEIASATDHNEAAMKVMDYLNCIPEACNVEKVIKELKSWSINTCLVVGEITFDNKVVISSERAIEIVKRGGIVAIEHDGCEGCKHFAKYSNIPTTTSDMPCYDCKLAHSQEQLKDLYEPMTNADKIRNMTDDELSQFMFNEIRTDRECMLGNNCKKDCGCSDCFLEWLKSEAEEGE